MAAGEGGDAGGEEPAAGDTPRSQEEVRASVGEDSDVTGGGGWWVAVVRLSALRWGCGTLWLAGPVSVYRRES